jgi:hypothetical protein
MNGLTAICIALALPVAALAPAACGDDSGSGGASASGGSAALPQGSEPVDLDPAEFTTEIDNPYFPLQPGSRWVYREVDAEGNAQRVVVTVTDRTREIANGITARVVRDVVSENGEPIEVTDDWFAQDSEGNVWYLGEDTAEYENGKVVSRSGSFEAGVDGAEAGIAMPADPEVGQAYRQEYYAGEAEDEAEVLALDGRASVPFGEFGDLVVTHDTTPLEPRVDERKHYAEGIGLVLAVHVSPDEAREELISYTAGG